MIDLDLAHETSPFIANAGLYAVLLVLAGGALLVLSFAALSTDEFGNKRPFGWIALPASLLGVTSLLVAGFFLAAAGVETRSDGAEAERERAVEVIQEAIQDEYQVSHVDTSPPEYKVGYTLKHSPLTALSGDVNDAPWVGVALGDGTAATYQVLFDNDTGTAELINDNPEQPSPVELLTTSEEK